jgi:uncharacterized protein (TIGR00255 family)
MIYSMTGYGRSELQRNGFTVRVELRSVNSRFMDLALKTSRELFNFENELKDLIRSKISRGRISAQIACSRDRNDDDLIQVDEAHARSRLRMLQKLVSALGLKDEVTLGHLLSFNDIFVPQEESTDEIDALLSVVRDALTQAINDLREMQLAEGEELAKDLKIRLGQLFDTVMEVETLAKDIPIETLKKLKERVSKLTVPEKLEPNRLEIELALMADRLDITEECVRLKSHIQLFRDTVESSEPASGKRLGFILQEMNREVNTLGSKSNCIEISHHTVSLKEEIERIREQVQNIE